MKTLLLLLALAGPLGFQQAVLVLSGASCAEELSEDEMARYQSLAAHPVDLNAAGRSRLLSTGLLTPYQVASLLDYRARSGAVLSWTELGLVDGFGAELAAALQEFCTLGTGRAAPGARPDHRLRHTLTLRTSSRAALTADGSSAVSALSSASPAGSSHYSSLAANRALAEYSAGHPSLVANSFHAPTRSVTRPVARSSGSFPESNSSAAVPIFLSTPIATRPSSGLSSELFSFSDGTTPFPTGITRAMAGGNLPILQFDSPAVVGGIKYELSVGERVALYWSTRTTYGEPQLSVGTVSAAWYGRRALGQLIVGNFGARFGQGLVQWSGFALSGYNSLGAFRRNGTGFSPTGSYSPALFGLATDWHFGPWRLSVAYSLAPTLADLIAKIAALRAVPNPTVTSSFYVLDDRIPISFDQDPTTFFSDDYLAFSIAQRSVVSSFGDEPFLGIGGLSTGALGPPPVRGSTVLLSAEESGHSTGRGLAALFLGGQPILNLTRTWRSATAGLTATGDAASLEARIALPAWSLFGELAFRYPRPLSSLLSPTPSRSLSPSTVSRSQSTTFAETVATQYSTQQTLPASTLFEVFPSVIPDDLSSPNVLAEPYLFDASVDSGSAHSAAQARTFNAPFSATQTASSNNSVSAVKAASSGGVVSASPASSAEVDSSSGPVPFIMWPVQAVVGTIWVPEYGHKAGIVGRWLGYGREYSGVAAGYEGPALSATADASIRPDTRAFQLKSLFQWHPTLTLSSPASADLAASNSADLEALDSAGPAPPFTLQPLLRAQLRWRPAEAVPPSVSPSSSPASALPSGIPPTSAFPFAAAGVRLDLRGMLTLTAGPWILAGRYDAVFGRGFAWNWYAETGWKSEAFSVYLRGGIFKVDEWDDRIYVYERDAPGSFTVPSRYGRGWDAALYAAWRPARRHTLWLRIETVQYPWALTPKDGRLELRLQYRYQSR